MSAKGPFRRLIAIVALALSLGLAACGGGGGAAAGGGGTPASILLSTASLSAQAKVTDLVPTAVTVSVTLAASASNPHGFGGSYTANGIGGVTWLAATDHSGGLRIDYRQPATLPPGVYHDTIRIGLCSNANCSAVNTSGQPTIAVTYTVLAPAASETPSVTLATGTVQMSGIVGDTTNPQATVTVTVTNPPAYSVAGNVVATHNGLYSAVYSVPGGSSGQIELVFKAPAGLAAGTYDDTVTVSACLEMGCANPVSVTPAALAVHYTISDTVGGALGYTVRVAPVQANDVAWDAVRSTLYLSVPPGVPGSASALASYDPLTDALGASVPAADTLTVLALSDDSQYLYAGYQATSAIQRFTLAPLAMDIAIPLAVDGSVPGQPAPVYASDIQVAPGQPHVVAAIQVNAVNVAGRGIRVFDDAIVRPLAVSADSYSTVTSIQWGADATRLYGAGGSFTRMAVDANGPVILSIDMQSGVTRIHYADGMAYTEHGDVIDVATGQFTSGFTLQGYWQSGAVDVTVGRIYFATVNNPSGYLQLEVFDLQTRVPIANVRLPAFSGFGNPTHLIRWGRDGLALVSSQGKLLLLKGPLVAP